MIKYHPLPEIEPIAGLLVLGRGIYSSGELTQTGKERSEIATVLAEILELERVVFSGGCSWRQEFASANVPISEGEGMLLHAGAFADVSHGMTEYIAEKTSKSTVANMSNSSSLLKLKEGDRLGILSDDLHFAYGRVKYIASLVFPGVECVELRIPRKIEKGDKREELFTTMATRLAMAGVKKGNLDVINGRQHKLEATNDFVRRASGIFTPRQGEIPEQQIEISYRDVIPFKQMDIRQLSGAMAMQIAA